MQILTISKNRKPLFNSTKNRYITKNNLLYVKNELREIKNKTRNIEDIDVIMNNC